VAHSLSSKKRIRQNEKRQLLNRSRRSALRKRIRVVRDALVHHDAATAEASLKDAVKVLDREADRGLLHRNTAARMKSRLSRRLNALKAEAKAG
jgi:small subunit ribosomal protein S20